MLKDRKKILLEKLDTLEEAMLWFAENLNEYCDEQDLWLALTADHGISSFGVAKMRKLLEKY